MPCSSGQRRGPPSSCATSTRRSRKLASSRPNRSPWPISTGCRSRRRPGRFTAPGGIDVSGNRRRHVDLAAALFTPAREGDCMAHKSVVRTERAPAPFQGAPYSQAIRCGDFVFVSGQLPLNPATGKVVGGSIQEQAEQVFANLQAILEEAGSGLDRLVKTTVFLTTLADFPGMNGVYARHVGEQPRARATVGIAALTSGANGEIEAIATVPA